MAWRLRWCVAPRRSAGSGLRFVPVEHFGNTNESTEEVEAVAGLVSELLSGNWSWVDEQAEESVVTLSDLLIVAPYNAQVALLREALPEGSRIGTVDKFQGQEAAIVIFSPAVVRAPLQVRAADEAGERVLPVRGNGWGRRSGQQVM